MAAPLDIAPPTDPFSEYIPSSDQPWDVPRAAHLLRRITFGSTSQRLGEMLALSPKQAIDALLDYDAQLDPFGDLVERMEGLYNLDSTEAVQRWWIYRMIYSTQPAQEKIALFWHNRFATSITKVGNPNHMMRQIELFRRMGLGSFRDLLIAIERDPAMLIWLDGQSNRKGKPNENFAREVMELFTLGVGNYTEKDVQELARAFTGWQLQNGKATFDPKTFDDGEKEVFGTKGKLDGESAVDLILRQLAAPKFLARKMLREFVHPQPTDEMVEYYARRLLYESWQIKPVLKQMLASRMFFSEWAYRSKIKSPAEIVVGGALAVGGKINTEFVRQTMNRLGQSLIMPPNVKGWDGQEAWINSNTVLARFNYGLNLATQREFAKRTDLEQSLTQMGLNSREKIIDHFGKVLLDSRLAENARADFMDYMGRGEKNEPREFVLNGSTVNSKVRGVMHLMMATPEFQLA